MKQSERVARMDGHTMISTAEAAKRLSISRSRVLELVKSGQLAAEKISGIWLIDEASVDARARSVSKKGGRPRRGSGRSEVRFTLMNRTHEVTKLVYDERKLEFVSIDGLADERRAPLGLADQNGIIALYDFNAWWRNRGIPRTRDGLDRILREAGARVPDELLYRNLGLSLSDQYWICPFDSGLSWEDINFFRNGFEPANTTAAMLSSARQGTRAHPDNTSDGNLQKTWIIRNGTRMLRKGGLRNNQEPFNEVVATALHRRLLARDAYVEYTLDDAAGNPACLCENFLTDQEEYIPATYVMRVCEQEASTSDFDHYLACCDKLGAAGTRSAIEQMIVCDDLMANTDRHFRNFGIVRNVETLTCRPAPIFDSGTSLWCDLQLTDLKTLAPRFTSKQFEASPARQMLLVEDLSWFSADALEGFVVEAMGILAKNDALAARLPFIERALERRVAHMVDIAVWM